MQNTVLWLIVAIVVVVIIVLAVIALTRSRGRRIGFEPRALPVEDLEGREERIDEIERMFVHQPREAVAAARLLVDELVTRMGYPVRLTAAERARDLAHFNRGYADRYRMAGELRDDASTEEMRRALKGYLDTAREIIGEAKGRAGVDRPRPVAEGPTGEVRPAGQPAVEGRPIQDDRPATDRPVTDERRAGEERPAAG